MAEPRARAATPFATEPCAPVESRHVASSTVARHHGGLAQLAAGRGSPLPSDVLDLSVSVNSLGPPEALLERLQSLDITRYPDPSCRAARSSLASWLGLPAGQVVVGSGAAELLWTLCRTLLREGSRALLWEPCFGEVAAAVCACRAQVHTVRWQTEQSWDDAAAALRQSIEDVRPTLVSLCAPTTPRGQHLPLPWLNELCERFGTTWFVVDQSFLGMSRRRDELLARLPANALLVRSLTKELGIPSVRVGYAIVPAELAPSIEAQRPAWSVSAAAQTAAQLYPELGAELETAVLDLLLLSSTLTDELRARGYHPFPSDTQYFVCDLPDDCTAPLQVHVARLLERHSVYVRDCTSFGLPRSFRVAAHPKQRRLLRALDELRRQESAPV